MSHYLYSQEQDKVIFTNVEFNAAILKNEIINNLKNNPTDIIEHLKGVGAKKYLQFKIINFYGVNPKNNKVSLIITKGEKEYFKSIE